MEACHGVQKYQTPKPVVEETLIDCNASHHSLVLTDLWNFVVCPVGVLWTNNKVFNNTCGTRISDTGIDIVSIHHAWSRQVVYNTGTDIQYRYSVPVPVLYSRRVYVVRIAI